ncbi:hypothetical protein Acsp04_43360 [Actinomadura sp. NBRC 104425]|uniref:DUF6882 domain-containing protein n=1 Tax=Actinomadura sp. NBRC 104425 TaxID=3032204 RepID=UPI0024A5CAC8|nr:DUF6882 domain-containing protein [Actinomadura sp. NBRC 104425]GLZ14101.1 hypothetical protein Acsp04_43360 [Actinomadura sp. NBRC 104425]
MSETITLANVLDDAALLSLEHQLHFAEVVGEHNWSVDLREQRFEFTGSRNLTCTRVHLLGSAAPGPQSWLWAWANPTGYPESLTAASAKVRDFGRQYGIPELASAEVPFSALPGRPADFRLEPARVAAMLLDAAKVVSGVWTYYHADVGRGTRAAFLIEHPEFQLPPPEFPRVIRILQQAVTEAPLTDHRRAIHSYARLRGLGAAFTPDHSGLTITGPGFTIEAAFDPHGRVSNITAQSTPPNAP